MRLTCTKSPTHNYSRIFQEDSNCLIFIVVKILKAHNILYKNLFERSSDDGCLLSIVTSLTMSSFILSGHMCRITSIQATPYRKPFVYILYDFRVIKLTRVGSFKKIATLVFLFFLTYSIICWRFFSKISLEG